MGRLRALSPRAEKTLRLSASCLVGAVFGVLGVVRESETLAWIGVGIVLAAILVGPLVGRALARG